MFGGVKKLLWVETVLRFVYPEKCRCCEAFIHPAETDSNQKSPENRFFCLSCWGKITPLSGPSCPVCAFPFPSEVALFHSPGHLCGECREAPPYFSKAITPYRYEGALAKAVQLLKYERQVVLATSLAALLMTKLAPLEIDLVTAIPLHVSKLRQREFNQSLLVAKEVSRRLAKPLAVDVMIRNRETEPQVGLSKKARKKNMRHVFSIQRQKRVFGKRILLIDDVYTTGATLKEAAKTLIKTGAQEVIVAAPTRMVLNGS